MHMSRTRCGERLPSVLQNASNLAMPPPISIVNAPRCAFLVTFKSDLISYFTADTEPVDDGPFVPFEPQTPPPAPPLPLQTSLSRHMRANNEPDDDPEAVEIFEGAGKPEPRQKTPAIQADFAAFNTEFGPFPSKADWDLARWATLENVSEAAISRLLVSEAANPSLAAGAARLIRKQIELLPGMANFKCENLRIAGMSEPFQFYYRPGIDVVADILADPTFAATISFAPERRWADGTRKTRLYSKMNSGEWWWNAQVSFITDCSCFCSRFWHAPASSSFQTVPPLFRLSSVPTRLSSRASPASTSATQFI